MTKLGRLFRTVRRLRPDQVACRARFALEAKCARFLRLPKGKAPAAPDPAAVTGLRWLADLLARYGPPPQEETERLRRNELFLLNAPVDCMPPVDWSCPDQPRLARFQLHSFAFVRTLASQYVLNPVDADRDRALAWIRDWIRQNTSRAGVGWHPYCVSSRIVNWCIAATVFAPRDADIMASLAVHAAYLARHLECDVRANHLLHNAAALVIAGGYLGRDDWKARGLALLASELTEQILPDGGHYEGSVMYHGHVLHDCVAVYAVLAEKPPFLLEKIDALCGFLAGMLHVDGQIPLFADSALHDGYPPRALLAAAGAICNLPVAASAGGPQAFPDSGYYVMERGDGLARMVAKGNWSAPDHQPGHSHCDWFSFELTLDTQRFVVDSGTEGYEAGPWREYCRGTRAHNTLQVDGRELFETWGAFRVGRRTRPVVEAWEEDGTLLRMSHRAYPGHRHTRVIRLVDDAWWLILERVDGRRTCVAESFLHFHPHVKVEAHGTAWRASHDAGMLTVLPVGDVDAVENRCGRQDPYQGWYCPDFGKMMPAPCLVFRREGKGPMVFGYALAPDTGSWPSVEQLAGYVEELRG